MRKVQRARIAPMFRYLLVLRDGSPTERWLPPGDGRAELERSL
jgi:hypothetical protein